MSALPPKADMSGARINVCFVPTAEVSGRRKSAIGGHCLDDILHSGNFGP